MNRFLLALLLSLAFGLHACAQRQQVKLRRTGNVFELDVSINGISRSYIFDTGASCVTINGELYDALCKAKKISNSDFTGRVIQMSTADGSTVNGRELYLRNLVIGDTKFNSVRAVLLESANAGLLLGQSVLSRFKYHAIENSVLIYEPKSDADQHYAVDSEKAWRVYYDAQDASQLSGAVDLLWPYYSSGAIATRELELLGIALYYVNRDADALECLSRVIADKSYSSVNDADLYAAKAAIHGGDNSLAIQYLQMYMKRLGITEASLSSGPNDNKDLGSVYFMMTQNALSSGDYDAVLRYVKIVKNSGYVPVYE